MTTNKLILDLAPYSVIFLLVGIFFIMTAMILILAHVTRKVSVSQQEKKRIQAEEQLLLRNNKEPGKLERTNAMRQTCAPDGVDPNINSYLVLDDAGKTVYVRSFSIQSMPKRAVFAVTFNAIANFGNCTSSILIDGLTSNSSQAMLDKHVTILEGEMLSAEEDGNRNRYRRLLSQIQETERWAKQIETMENSFFSVAFVYSLYAYDLPTLNSMTDRFVALGRESGIDLTSCFAAQSEAYLTNSCLDQKFSLGKGFVRTDAVKSFIMDQLSLSTIFNYNSNEFRQDNGIVVGRNFSGGVILYDVFSKTHNGYNVLVQGTTGSGKSLAVKVLAFRMAYNTRFVCIDSQRPKHMNEGEYCPLCRALNGVIYTISASFRKCILNIFELRPTHEVEKDAAGEIISERDTLELNAAISNVTDIILLIATEAATTGNAAPDYSTMVFFNSEITSICRELYDECGIIDGDAESLYEEVSYTYGRKRRKKLPEFRQFYMKLLERSRKNTETELEKEYRLLKMALRECVYDLYYLEYGERGIKFFSSKEAASLPEREGTRYYAGVETDNKEVPVSHLHGVRAYFDGQSTIELSTHSRFTNLDISGVPNSDLNMLRLVCCKFINENFVKVSSVGKDADHLVYILDEVKSLWQTEYAKRMISTLYRTARKMEVSAWCITQSISDYGDDEYSRAIIENTSAFFLFRHADSAREDIQKKLNLTDSQLQTVLTLGVDPNETDPDVIRAHMGEVCIVDMKHVYFGKVEYFEETEAIFARSDRQVAEPEGEDAQAS